jgi:hypothetical protein
MTVLPRSLAVGFNHVQLANPAQIDQIPGFLEFEKFMHEHPILKGLSLSASCVAVHLSFSPSFTPPSPSLSSSSPLSEISSPLPEASPLREEIPTQSQQILTKLLHENPTSFLSHLSQSSALSLISDIINCDMLLNMLRLHQDADFAEMTRLFSCNANS